MFKKKDTGKSDWQLSAVPATTFFCFSRHLLHFWQVHKSSEFPPGWGWYPLWGVLSKTSRNKLNLVLAVLRSRSLISLLDISSMWVLQTRTHGWKTFQTLTPWVKEKQTIKTFTSRLLCLIERTSTASSSLCRSGTPPLLLPRLSLLLSPSFSNRAWCRACVACVYERTGTTTYLKSL